MKRADDVFFFTLIDFLVQVFFFGLLLFVLGKAVEAKKEVKQAEAAKQVDGLLKTAGVSSLAELTDRLTRLAPITKLEGMATFLSKNGGEKEVQEAINVVTAAGGAAATKEKIKKYEEAYGAPPCLSDEVNGKTVPRTVAVLRVEDEYITVQRSSADFERLLAKMGVSFGDVQRLSLADFRRQFQPLTTIEPSCRYFVEVNRVTQFYKPMQTVWSGFKTK